jgi:hypothetical protein
VYRHLKYADAPMPRELIDWYLARDFGWTFEEIGKLSMKRLHEYYQIKDAYGKAGMKWLQ